jgi:ribosomal-protein-alanine N-acetyltransferase
LNGRIELEKKEMRIETERLIIRPFREEDADALYRIKTDPRVMEYCPDFLDVDAQRAGMQDYIRAFQKMEETGDTDTWRCYAIESRETGEVMGALTFGKQTMLHEYDLGWMMIGAYAGKGYASEAAEAFAEDFCRTHGVDYLTAVMDVDNPASRRTAEKSGFRLFEKRTVYDYHWNRYCDDYYYFRRYWSGCTLKDRYYGDSPYCGRSTSDRNKETC